jgi:hypothetical protein
MPPCHVPASQLPDTHLPMMEEGSNKDMLPDAGWLPGVLCLTKRLRLQWELSAGNLF